jgi:hypothetical protein
MSKEQNINQSGITVKGKASLRFSVASRIIAVSAPRSGCLSARAATLESARRNKNLRKFEDSASNFVRNH